jgi:hypothetical protein
LPANDALAIITEYRRLDALDKRRQVLDAWRCHTTQGANFMAQGPYTFQRIERQSTEHHGAQMSTLQSDALV